MDDHTKPLERQSNDKNIKFLLTLLNLDLMSSSWILRAGKYTIGRLSSHQIILDDVTVSRNHASIEIINEDVKIYDNNSTNGVYINGNLIQNNASIKSGDQLINESEDITDESVKVVKQMKNTCLSIQGPPGTGKTYNLSLIHI